jgi:imidazoleglycerol-phosphate dehydratase / histidinol-phosphatase
VSLKKTLFIDRDGTLIEEPADEQIDAFEKLKLLPGVIPALIELKRLGYALVMVTNQDGLGTARFPEDTFWPTHQLLLQILDSQGAGFDAVHIDRHFPADNAFTRKPNIGMVLPYLQAGDLDRARSAVIGDRQTDLDLAANMGIRGIRIGANGLSWPQIVAELKGTQRRATVQRNTRETQIEVSVDLDGDGADIHTGLGFFDHMLDQIAKHGGIGLKVQCRGDLHIDEHHTVEDCALALGEALGAALGDKRGIQRYGFALPMDETRAEALIDLSGRPYFVFSGQFPRAEVGGLATELVPHFFRSISDALRANVHLTVTGENTHHMVEACFKAFARALRMAKSMSGLAELASTKGTL